MNNHRSGLRSTDPIDDPMNVNPLSSAEVNVPFILDIDSEDEAAIEFEGGQNIIRDKVESYNDNQNFRHNQGTSFVYNSENIPEQTGVPELSANLFLASRYDADSAYSPTEQNNTEAMKNEYGGFLPLFNGGNTDGMDTRQKEARESRLKRITRENGEQTGLDINLCWFAWGTLSKYSHTRTVADFKNLVDAYMARYDFNRPTATRMATYRPLLSSSMSYPSIYILAHRRLRCFDLLPFVQCDGAKYYGDLFVPLISNHDLIDDCTYLGVLCRQFHVKARRELALFICIMVSIVSTTFVMLPNLDNPNQHIGMEHVNEALRLYPSRVWNTNDMPSQSRGCQSDLTDGFNLVSETTKILMDEIRNEVCQETTSIIGQQDVRDRMDICAIIVLEEMFGYLYCRLQEKPDVEAFVTAVRSHIEDFYDCYQRRNVREARAEYRYYPLDRLRALITRMRAGEPAMGAELRFNASTFQPVVQAKQEFPRTQFRFEPNEILRRARWTEGPSLVPARARTTDSWSDDVPIRLKKDDGTYTTDIHEINTYNTDLIGVHEARDLPTWLQGCDFKPSTYYRTNVPVRDRVPTATENFVADEPDSDQEFEVYNDNDRVRAQNYPLLHIGDALEQFYKEMLDWIIHPADANDFGHINSTEAANAGWLRWYFQQQKDNILGQVTHAKDLDQYVAHMKAFLILSLRGTVRQAIRRSHSLRDMRETPEQFLEELYEQREEPRWFRCLVDRVSASRDLFHIDCSSNDPEFIREMFDSLLGLTLCVAYFACQPSQRKKGTTGYCKVLFMVIRHRHFEVDDELDRDPCAADFTRVNLRMSVSRDVLRSQSFDPAAEQFLYFQPVVSLATELRMYRAIYMVETLPESFRNIMYGDNNVKVYYDPFKVRLPVSRSTLTQADLTRPVPVGNNNIRNMVRSEVDRGSLQYMIRCLHDPLVTVDRTHFNAMVQVMRVVGNGAPNSSGISLVQGPPGTGKTTMIIFIIGCLLHHSRYGHVNRPPIDYRRQNDGILRCARGTQSFKILVVASSNQAVDNILERLHAGGIPIGNNESINPSMLRIVAHNYQPKLHLRQYTVREASVLYDDDHANRNNPSLQARRRRADEAIIYLSTAASCGGPGLRELRQTFDIVLQDEGAFSSECETLIPLTATSTMNGSRRLFYLSVGDEKQLPALNHINTMLVNARLTKLAPFDPVAIASSMFERLIASARATHVFLDTQFRMHPAISRSTSTPFYNCYFRCPLPLSMFLTPYNQPDVEYNGMHPMTFIDTSGLNGREETMIEQGHYINEIEATIVSDVINRLYMAVPYQQLDSEIAVIAPYRAQIGRITTVLRTNVEHAQTAIQWAQRDIKICTVDSMQGSQRSVVIFCATRSNNYGNVGFVSDMRRLNVSFTRARFLNVIIADIKTMDFGREEDRKGADGLRHMYNICATGREPGARLAKAQLNNTNPQFGHYIFHYKPVRNPPTTRAASTSSETNPQLVEANPDVDYSTLFRTPAASTQT